MTNYSISIPQIIFNIMLIFFVFFELVVAYKFGLTQTLTEIQNYTTSTSLSSDNFLAIGTTDRKVYIYHQNISHSSFSLFQTLQTTVWGGIYVKMPNTGNVLVCGFKNSSASIFTKDIRDISNFSYLQNIQAFDFTMNELTYVDITDDSLEVVVASNTSIVVYEFDGSSFILSQNITVNESLRSVQVSDSHKYLSVGVLGNQIYIFEKVSNQYILTVTHTYTNSAGRKVQINNDSVVLVGSYSENCSYVYDFDGIALTNEKVLLYDGQNRYVTISADNQYVVSANQVKSFVHSLTSSNSYTQLQFLKTSTTSQALYTSEISEDNQMIIMGGDGHVYIYTNTQTSPQYQILQTLPITYSREISISNDNKLLGVGNTISQIFIYEQSSNSTQFTLKQIIDHPQSGGNRADIRITGDGQWLLSGYSYSFAILYHKKNDQFIPFQQFKNFSSCSSCATYAYITDDHLQFILGVDNQVFLYELQDNEYVNIQNFTLTQSNANLRSIQVTNDHRYMVFGIYGRNIEIYQKNDNSYELITIHNFSTSRGRKAQISQQQDIVVVFSYHQNISYVYDFNGSLHNERIIEYYGQTRDGIISHDGKYIVSANSYLSDIYKFDDSSENYKYLQTLQTSQALENVYYVEISDDDEFIIAGGVSGVYIYFKNTTDESTKSRQNKQNAVLENFLQIWWVRLSLYMLPGIALVIMLCCCLYHKTKNNQVQDIEVILSGSTIPKNVGKMTQKNKEVSILSVQTNFKKIGEMSESI